MADSSLRTLGNSGNCMRRRGLGRRTLERNMALLMGGSMIPDWMRLKIKVQILAWEHDMLPIRRVQRNV